MHTHTYTKTDRRTRIGLFSFMVIYTLLKSYLVISSVKISILSVKKKQAQSGSNVTIFQYNDFSCQVTTGTFSSKL